MAFLDFLKPNGRGKAKRADLAAALEKIAVERAAAQLVLDGLERRREDLLRADAPASGILALDVEGEAARIKLEKLDIFEAEVHARLSELDGADAEIERRKRFEKMIKVARDLAVSLGPVPEKLAEFQNALSDASMYGTLMAPPPRSFRYEAVQQFIRDVELAEDHEMRRRAAIERRQETQG
jgi:hypothetical protein